jgi:hypothetical protein
MSIMRGENFHIPLHNSLKRTQSFFQTSAVENQNERSRFPTTLPQPHGGEALAATRRSKQAAADFQPAEGKGELRGRENGRSSRRGALSIVTLPADRRREAMHSAAPSRHTSIHHSPSITPTV